MSISRRDFLKLGSSVAASSLIGILSLSSCKRLKSKLKNAKAGFGVCPLCSMGCGIVVFFKGDEIIYIHGNPEHPVNKGTLCQKGQSLSGLFNNKDRLNKIKYRAPYTEKWTEITWDQAIEKISRNIKKTIDETFLRQKNNQRINQTEGIVSIAGDTLTNEEAYLFTKFSRLLGVAAVAHKGAILNSDVSAALYNVFGLDVMTNPFSDTRHTDLAIVIGYDPAADSGVLFKHLSGSFKNGAKLLTVDPKITRTAAMSNYYLKITPETDLVFFNGIINYILQNDKFNKEYLLENTDISYLVNPDFNFDHSKNIFSGFDKRYNRYTDKTSWDFVRDGRGNPKRDDDLLQKNSVFQIIKDYFSYFSIEMVTGLTGCSVDQFLEIAELITKTGIDTRSAVVLYGGGIIKQPDSGQIVHALSIIQLLLGNIGVAGGGIFSGKSLGNQQGVSDQIGEWNFLPGDLQLPINNNTQNDKSLRDYIQNNKQLSNDPLSINQWGMFDKFITSLLKAWYKEKPGGKDRFNFKLLPVIKDKYNFNKFLTDLRKNKSIRGLILPELDLINIGLHKDKLKQAFTVLDWLVVTDIWDNETASFWQNNKLPEKRIKTEVFLLPALSPLEKTGSYTSADRNVQFTSGIKSKFKKARSELWILNNLFKKIRSDYSGDKGTFSGILNQANWDYSEKDICFELDKEISGIDTREKPVQSPDELKSDGSTLCGNWFYCGMVTEEENLSSRRDGGTVNSGSSLYTKWGWTWPENVRVLYNRASINRKGEIRNPEKWVIKQKDNSFIGDRIHGKEKSFNIHPFVFKYDGMASIFCKKSDTGPLPVSLQNSFLIGLNGKMKFLQNLFFRYKNRYPYFALISGINKSSIYKNMEWLQELNSNSYCEISKRLAVKKNLKNGAVVNIRSLFGRIKLPVFINEGIDSFIVEKKSQEFIYIYGQEALKIVPDSMIYLSKVPVEIMKGVV